jgi:hypothetical protein
MAKNVLRRPLLELGGLGPLCIGQWPQDLGQNQNFFGKIVGLKVHVTSTQNGPTHYGVTAIA